MIPGGARLRARILRRGRALCLRHGDEAWSELRWTWIARTDRWAAGLCHGPVPTVLIAVLRRRGPGARFAGVWLGKATEPRGAEELVVAMVGSAGPTADALATQVAKWARWSGWGQWTSLPCLRAGVLNHVAGEGLAHRSAAVREATVALLGQSGEERFVGPLGARVRDEREDEQVRRSAVAALGRLPRTAALGELNGSVAILHGGVRSDVARVIGDDMTPAAKRAMVHALDVDAARRAARTAARD